MYLSSSTDRLVAMAALTMDVKRLREHGYDRAEQALVLARFAGGELHDGLEMDLVPALEREEIVERLGHRHVRRLGHPDPVGDTRELHGGGERDEIPLPLRQCGIDADEAVVRVPHRARDLGGSLVGELRGGPDDARARIEVEDAATRNAHGQVMAEARVARPEQALVARAGTAEESHS
jgi:hypothetical protein